MADKIIGTTSSEYENVQVKEEGPEMEPEEGIEVLQQEATLHTTNIKVEPVYDSFDNSPWDSGSIGVSIKHDFDEGCPEKIYPKVEPETVEEFLNAEDVIHKYETHEKEVEEDANLQREATNLHKFVEIEIEQVYNNIPGDNGSMCVSMKQNVDQGDPANEEPELTDIEDNEFVSAVRENVDSGTYCQQEIKGPLKKHQCGICGKVLANRGSYTKHTRKHISKAPFQCEVCLRSFTERGSLVTHKRSHTGEKPYKCNTCPMAFPRLETLKVHIRTHTGETPFTCHVCQKSFTLERNLKKHIIKHSSEKPFKCDICHRRFTEYRALKVHVRLHTGEKPYKCDTCQSTFQRCEQLREHIRTHTGDNRYQCKICLTIFTQLCKLKRHMNRLRGCQAPS